jgi:hypothetical protein
MSGVSRQITEQVLEAPTTQSVLEKKFARNSASDLTPSVRNVEKLKMKNIGPVTVTKFDEGQENQEISILGDGQTTIANNAFIKTNTGANKLLAVDKVYRFTMFNGVWVEDA